MTQVHASDTGTKVPAVSTTAVKPLEEHRPCADIAQQLQAIESAMTKAKKTLIHDHIDHCLEETPSSDHSNHKSIEALKGITKYL